MRHLFTKTRQIRSSRKRPLSLKRPATGRTLAFVIALFLCLGLLGQVFYAIAPQSAWARILTKRTFQEEEVLAPSARIQPTSVSVINFAELATKDAKASQQIQPNAAPVLRVVHPPKTIAEIDAAVSERSASASSRSDEVHPLVSSPAPSASFLAQEDGPEAGTGTFDIPPDTMGAVGPDRLFVNVNNNYRVQDKTTGAALSTVSIETFWSSTGVSGVFDPRVQYDPYNNRWIVAAISNSGTANSSVVVGVSATSDPQGTFTLFRFTVGCAAGSANCDANGEMADFPMLGFNKNWVAISWNQFQIAGSGSFVAGKMLAIDYPTLRTGTANSMIFTVTQATNIAAFCMHPATTLSATEDTLYVPTHISSANATYRLHKLTGTPSVPVYMLDTVSRMRTGGGWTQPGGEILPQTCVGTPGVSCPTTPRFIDSGDAFIRSSVVFRNANIWYAQTISLPAGGLGQANMHTAAQWTRIDTSGNFIDGGRVEDPTADSSLGEWYAYASITVNANSDVLLGFSTFAKTHFARAGYAMRLGTDAPGTMGDPVVFKEGEDYYSKDFGGARNRWGDYSHSVVDPSNDQDFWTIQEYAGTRVIQDSQQTTNTSRWGTWWAKIPPNGPPPSPTPTVSPTPAGCPTQLVITDNGDGDDVAPGNRVCATANGACTLRAAIEEANALTTCGTIDITFNNVASPITLGITLPTLNHNVNLNGPGANTLTVMRSAAAGTPNFRIFTIESGKTVNISGLTVSNGNINSGLAPANSGGAIGNGGTLTLTNIIVSGNTAINGGGGIFNNGTLTLSNSTVTGNSANVSGGGIYNAGGATNVVNSTVSGNSAAGEGGGIFSANSGITLTNVTVTNNRCDSDNRGNEQGGGISTLGGSATLKNTIVAGNYFGGSGTIANDFANCCGTNVSSSAFNLFGTGSGGLTNGVNNNQVGVSNPGLGLLANNGGPTRTHALMSGSPAINAGSNALAFDQNNNPLTTDQRGNGFNRIVNGTVDIGAFELQPGEIPPTPTPTATPTVTPTPTPTPTPPPCLTFTVNNNGDTSDAIQGDAVCATAGGACTLRAAIQEANALQSCGTINITFSGVTSPISLLTALPEINHDVNIKGPGANQLTVQRSTAGGTPSFRIFRSLTNRVVTISDLTLANGNVGSGDGGAINSDGPLTLVNCTFYGNTAQRGGAIFFASTIGLMNPLVLSNCNVGGTAVGQANSGWGLYASGKVTITGGSIVGNSSGGLVLSSGPNLLDGVVISNNTSNLDGGGADIWSGATFINCLIANNTATRNGGGIHGSVNLINSTISGNRSGGAGGAIFGGGPMTNVTITNNRSDFDNTGGELGGGINGSVLLSNSIVALNFRGGSGSTADDISGTANSSSSFNLVGTGGAGGLVNGTNNNQVGVVNPLLGPLASNGGPTQTHALLPGSPAINAGSNALAVNQNNSPLTTDQRGAGFNRIVNGTVDIGAFELQAAASTIQFSSSSYTVSEGSPRVDITLTRSGDTTSSASVGYQTIDGAGLQDCATKNGIASPRCDYETTVGTLTFAAGQTSASFSVAIVDDSYAEGPETFNVSLNNPSGARLGAQSTATVTIIDNDTVDGPNPIDQTSFFVRQQYIDFLGREPDPGGGAAWVSIINGCAQGDTTCDRVHVSQNFFQSEEFQTRGYFIYRFYPVSFPNVSGSDPPGYGHKPDYMQFVPDLARVSGFLDANQLEAAKVAFIADFMLRPAWAARYGSLGNTQYVDTLLNTANVTVSASTRQGWIDGLNNSTLTRAQVLRQIAESPEVYNKYYNPAFAIMEYFGYLRRDPDAAYLTWIQVLNQTNDPRGMITGFVNSNEYKQRFGP